MPSRPWMPLYVAEYLGDTSHLSTVEHGAYMLLIMHYWQTGKLPTTDSHLARICRMTDREWAAIRDTLAPLFLDGWRHKRIDQELVKAEELVAKRTAAGKAGASARYGNGISDRIADAELTDGIARGNSQSPLPEERDTNVSPKKSANGKHPPEPYAQSELETVLDPQRAAAVVEHRKKLKKPLTPHAAKLLAGAFQKCADPNVAADMMIARGWQGFDPEWMQNQAATGPPKSQRRDQMGQPIS